MAGEGRLPGATKAKEQKAEISQLAIPEDSHNLAGSVESKVSFLLS